MNTLNKLFCLLSQLCFVINSLSLYPQLYGLFLTWRHGWFSILATPWLLWPHKSTLLSYTRDILLILDYFWKYFEGWSIVVKLLPKYFSLKTLLYPCQGLSNCICISGCRLWWWLPCSCGVTPFMMISGWIILTRSLLLTFPFIVLQKFTMLQIDFLIQPWNNSIF